MKNVLIISSSPRKNGNTNTLCEQFKKGAEAKGHHVDLVRIMEKKIGFCLAWNGCFLCKICTKSRAVCKRHPESSQKVCKNGQERLQYTTTYFCF